MNPIPPCTDAPSAPHHEADGRDFQILKDDGLRALLMGEMPYAIRCFSAALKIKDDAEVAAGWLRPAWPVGGRLRLTSFGTAGAGRRGSSGACRSGGPGGPALRTT